ncbi:hypothetical protein PoB_001092500 [Plakobranchus ocellatus]|uniref:Uncharacterized protein n=1 Tax=Plakobranchus ocellatus TaxID=259542 RepID=A0AAV3YNY4_9GAST|nr:hypothetical protein PoB_001092500 [Plakobranchus ocellatus]
MRSFSDQYFCFVSLLRLFLLSGLNKRNSRNFPENVFITALAQSLARQGEAILTVFRQTWRLTGGRRGFTGVQPSAPGQNDERDLRAKMSRSLDLGDFCKSLAGLVLARSERVTRGGGSEVGDVINGIVENN